MTNPHLMVHTDYVTFLGLQGGKSRCFDPCCSKGGLSLGWGKMVNLVPSTSPRLNLPQSICTCESMVLFGEDIENMETDLSDCIALTALYAMIKEGTAIPCRFVACHFDVRWTSK